MIAARRLLLLPPAAVIGLCLHFSAAASAQSAIPSVVQLPSFQTFFYSGSVLVPDGGAAYLGGVPRSSSFSSRQGLNRATGQSLSHPHVAVQATIIDHQQIDEQLLGGTPAQFLRLQRGQPRRIDPTEEGKSLVRFARVQYRAGNASLSFDSYLAAIGLLNGRLRELASTEFRRVHGSAADQALRMAALVR